MREKGFNSITGWRVNDPSVCIKGNGNFACVCADCMARFQEFAKSHPVIQELLGRPTTPN